MFGRIESQREQILKCSKALKFPEPMQGTQSRFRPDPRREVFIRQCRKLAEKAEGAGIEVVEGCTLVWCGRASSECAVASEEKLGVIYNVD